MAVVQSPDPRAETVIAGRYRLGQELGRGGHGVVYVATQLPIGREVALKMLLPEAVLARGAVERFMREASLAQRLTHPNTVQLIDFGQTEQGLPFIAWERLRGRTLEQEIARGPLSVERTARVAMQVLKSLMEAHAHGIVHRDIKPSNVFLADHAGEADFVKVLDFGVARPTPTDAGAVGITRDGQLIGTPSYMAPEQVRGAELSPATDLYALGLVMAEALSGVCIMHDALAVNVWARQASSEPVPLPMEVRRSALGPLIERATRKASRERYASGAEMLADVERALLAGTAATDPLARPLTARPDASFQPTTPLASPSAPPLGVLPVLPTTPLHTTPRQTAPFHTPAPNASWPAQSAPPPAMTPSFASNASATPARPASNVAAKVIAVVALLIVLSLVAGLGAFFAYAYYATRGAREAVSNEKALALETLGAEREARLEALGWTVLSASEAPIPTGHYTQILVQRGAASAHIEIIDYATAEAAARAAKGSDNPMWSVSSRKGARVVRVTVAGDTALAESVLDVVMN